MHQDKTEALEKQRHYQTVVKSKRQMHTQLYSTIYKTTSNHTR